MIEVIYKEERAAADEEVSSFTIPRNIRQVGLAGENFRIYMEDYVYTFLKKLSEKNEPSRRSGSLAILKGETHWKNEITYVFVRGAVIAKAKETGREQIVLSEENWEQIHQEEEKYFPDDETVGWFYAEPDLPMRMSNAFDSVHLKYFGADKICMLMDPAEKEEAFFRYENNSLIRQCGYYLYYEKNPRMQTYMIEKKQDLSDGQAEPAKDEAVKAFRKRIEETAEEEKQPAVKVSGSGGFLSYAATACLAFAGLAAGLNFYRSYRQAEQPERSVQSVSSDTVSSVSATPAGSSGELQNRSSVRGQKNAEDNEASDLEKSEEPKVSPKVSGTEEPDTKTKTEEISEIEKTGTETSSGKTHAKDTAAGPVHETYVIRPGDTLFQICLEHYGSLERLQKLCELNGITEHDLIYPGEILILP